MVHDCYEMLQLEMYCNIKRISVQHSHIVPKTSQSDDVCFQLNRYLISYFAYEIIEKQIDRKCMEMDMDIFSAELSFSECTSENSRKYFLKYS